MNRVTQVSLLIIALLGGYGIGYAYRLCQHPPIIEVEPIIPEPIIITNTVPGEASVQEKELLLQAIKELDLTTAELDEARAQLKAQEESVRRYDWLMNKWAEKGFGNNHTMNSHWNSFNPGMEAAEFFGWNKELVDKIEKAALSTSISVKEWEGANAVYVESQEDKLVYEIPAAPGTYKENYLQAMSDILPPEDFSLLASKFEEQFQSMLAGREVSLYIGPPPAGRMFGAPGQQDQDYMIVEVKTKSESFPGYMPRSTSMMPYKEGRTIPMNWNHIFQLEVDPSAGEPYFSGKDDLP